MAATSTAVKRRSDDGAQAAAASPLSAEELRQMHAYWRAANYLSVGQIYLMDNPLLKEPLHLKHGKPRLLGHWGPYWGAPAPPLRCRWGSARTSSATWRHS